MSFDCEAFSGRIPWTLTLRHTPAALQEILTHLVSSTSRRVASCQPLVKPWKALVRPLHNPYTALV